MKWQSSNQKSPNPLQASSSTWRCIGGGFFGMAPGIAARLNRYQSRRKPRPPRYPSLRCVSRMSSIARTGFRDRPALPEAFSAFESGAGFGLFRG